MAYPQPLSPAPERPIMKRIIPLLDRQIATAKPKDTPYKLFDGQGLFILCCPSGSKLWRLKYSFDGREKLLALGVYPHVSLKAARQKRDEAKEMLAAGVDPSAVKQEAKAVAQAEAREAANTFEAVAREWFSKKRSTFCEGHQKTILSRLERQLLPDLGAMPFTTIEPAHILATIRKAEARGAIETAHRLAQIAGQVCRYARLCGYVKYDVAAGLSEALPSVQTQHYATITDPQEIGQLLRDIDDYPGDISIVFALKILPYVFLRSCELRGAEWQEIKLEAGEWVVPAGRMKMKKPHLVPLAPQVVSLLEALKEFTGHGALVFPSPHSATRCISDMGLLNAIRRMGYGQDRNRSPHYLN